MLLASVILGSAVMPAIEKQTKTVITPNTKSFSPNDLIDTKETYKYPENTRY